MPTISPIAVDAPDAHELLFEYFAMRVSTFPGHTYTTVYPDPSVFEPPAGVFVIARDEDGTGVGCGGIRRIEDGPHGPRYEVKHLYLRPEARGQGWARLLLADLERRAVSFGASELVLDTHHTLEAAGRLYDAAGFATIDPYNDNPNATRWYAKPLHSARQPAGTQADQTG